MSESGYAGMETAVLLALLAVWRVDCSFGLLYMGKFLLINFVTRGREVIKDVLLQSLRLRDKGYSPFKRITFWHPCWPYLFDI